MAKGSVLGWVTVGLLLAVVGDRALRLLTDEPADPNPRTEQAYGGAPGEAVADEGAAARVRGLVRGDRSAERAARSLSRRLLALSGSDTYIDSLLSTTDSVVRRWPDRRAAPLRVAIIEGGASIYEPRMADLVREALAIWEASNVGVRVAYVADTAGADIVVRWIERFDFDRAGQTDLTWDQLGHVRHAAISLAVRTNTGVPLPEPALLAVAVHETGHALGLPHSADSTDVMFPATRTSILSERDRRTAALLYQLAPGQLRDDP